MSKREERAVAIPRAGGAEALEGIYIAGIDDDAVGVVVAAPHPLYGGSMDSPVVNEVAYAARAAGLASLRFNWRGVGASAGVPSGEAADADADYRAALDHLLASVPGAAVAAGYSFGAAAAVRVGVVEPRVRRLLLVAPPPALLDTAALGDFGGGVLIAVGDQDPIAPAAELERIAAALPRGRFEVIRAADHFFGCGLAEVGRVAGDFLKGT